MGKKIRSVVLCPCGSGRALDACCGPLLSGDKTAETPEALMRSRYTAYALGDDAYVLATWDEATRPAELFARGEARPKWLRLAVESSSVHEDGATGEVTFTATGCTSEGAFRMTERSLFRRTDEGWVYVKALVDGMEGDESDR